MKLVLTARARRRAAVVATWWRANRSRVPELFDEELGQAVRNIAREPDLGRPYETVAGDVVRRASAEERAIPVLLGRRGHSPASVFTFAMTPAKSATEARGTREKVTRPACSATRTPAKAGCLASAFS